MIRVKLFPDVRRGWAVGVFGWAERIVSGGCARETVHGGGAGSCTRAWVGGGLVGDSCNSGVLAPLFKLGAPNHLQGSDF